jgi:hypothetical protein
MLLFLSQSLYLSGCEFQIFEQGVKTKDSLVGVGSERSDEDRCRWVHEFRFDLSAVSNVNVNFTANDVGGSARLISSECPKFLEGSPGELIPEHQVVRNGTQWSVRIGSTSVLSGVMGSKLEGSMSPYCVEGRRVLRKLEGGRVLTAPKKELVIEVLHEETQDACGGG